MTQPTPPADDGHITLMAAGDLRDALAAHQRGDTPAAVHALLAIDAASWRAVEARLSALGGSLPDLLTAVREDTR
jgi:hypothetical protein